MKPPLYQMVHRCLNFDASCPPAVDPNDDEEEEDFPTAPPDDIVLTYIEQRFVYTHGSEKIRD